MHLISGTTRDIFDIPKKCFLEDVDFFNKIKWFYTQIKMKQNSTVTINYTFEKKSVCVCVCA